MDTFNVVPQRRRIDKRFVAKLAMLATLVAVRPKVDPQVLPRGKGFPAFGARIRPKVHFTVFVEHPQMSKLQGAIGVIALVSDIGAGGPR